MHRKRMMVLIAAMSVAASSAACFAENMTAPEAVKHIGETATVCGTVASSTVSKYGVGGRGRPVSFQIDKPEPETQFFFVAWPEKGNDLDQFQASYKDKKVCVTGKISQFNQIPYILTTDVAQVKLETPAK